MLGREGVCTGALFYTLWHRSLRWYFRRRVLTAKIPKADGSPNEGDEKKKLRVGHG